MTMLFRASLTSLTILTGQTTSRIVDVDKECYDAEAILVQAPSDINGKTYTWDVSLDGTNFVTLQDTSAANIAVPAAGKAIIYNGVLTAIKKFRLLANAPTGIDVTFQLSKSFRAGD